MSGRVLLGRYELGRELGAGAAGKVFEAHDRQLERKVAVKVLSRQQSGEMRTRFVREAKLLARIQDAHVVAVFDVGVSAEDDPFIVMELLAGGTLRQRIAERRTIRPLEAASFARDLSRGLSALHAAGLVHRDVKPGNAVIASAGEREIAKLLDLGVAHAADQSTLSEPGAVLGTALYIAPEQIRGGDLDGRADIYSLGATLFEMIEGRPPFGRPTAVETIHAHLFDPPPRLGAGVPRPIADIVAKCLAKRVEDRFATSDLLTAALTRAIDAGEPAPAAIEAPLLVLPELLDDDPPKVPASLPSPSARETRLVPAVAPVQSSADDEPLAPLELALEAHASPSPSVEPAMSEPEDAPPFAELEVNRDGPIPLGLMARSDSVAPAAYLDVQPAMRAPAPLASAPPSALVGIFAVFPAELHLRLGVGAFTLAWLVLLVSRSLLLFGLCMAISVFGWAGYFMRRRGDGSDG